MVQGQTYLEDIKEKPLLSYRGVSEKDIDLVLGTLLRSFETVSFVVRKHGEESSRGGEQ